MLGSFILGVPPQRRLFILGVHSFWESLPSADGRAQVFLREHTVSYIIRNKYRPSKNDSSARAGHLVRGSLRQLEERLNVDFKFASLNPAGCRFGLFPEALRAFNYARFVTRAIPIILDADRGWGDAQLHRVRSRLPG